VPQPVHTPNFMSTNGKNPGGENIDIMTGAQALSNLAAGQDHAQNSGTMSPDGSGAASWGNMINPGLNFGTAPGIGAPPYLSRHSSTPNLAHAQHYPFQHVNDWQHQYNAMHDNTLQMQRNSYFHLQYDNSSRPRQQSININNHSHVNNPFNLIPQYIPNNQNSAPGKPALVHYGSDPNIKPNGYNGPDYSTYVDQKGGNLNNVPFADQAATKASKIKSPPGNLTQLNERNYFGNMSNGSRSNQPAPSPRNMGGLPMSGPMSGSHLQGLSHANFGFGGASRDDNNDLPRKRRKSQTEHDEDDDYNPRGNIPKRGPKVPKAHDDEDDFETPDNSAYKRRKSNATGLPSANKGSYSPGSPSDPASPSGDASKSRRSKSRQNLSEAEKRQNHILSEQRRRNVIKNGYADLDNLVPVLNHGKSGLSKADALKESITFLENVLSGNEWHMEQLGLEDEAAIERAVRSIDAY
jgi:hypothetical protein